MKNEANFNPDDHGIYTLTQIQMTMSGSSEGVLFIDSYRIQNKGVT